MKKLIIDEIDLNISCTIAYYEELTTNYVVVKNIVNNLTGNKITSDYNYEQLNYVITGINTHFITNQKKQMTFIHY